MRKDKKEKKKTKKKSSKFFLVFILILMIVLGAYLGYRIQKNGGGLQGILATVLGQDAEKLENVEPINILVLRN